MSVEILSQLMTGDVSHLKPSSVLTELTEFEAGNEQLSNYCSHKRSPDHSCTKWLKTL